MLLSNYTALTCLCDCFMVDQLNKLLRKLNSYFFVIDASKIIKIYFIQLRRYLILLYFKISCGVTQGLSISVTVTWLR